MDLRREKKKGNNVVGILIVAIIVCVCAIIYVAFGQPKDLSDQLVFPEVDGIDARAFDLKLTSQQLKNAGKNDGDQFSYKINSSPVFENGEGDLEIENPVENRYLMAVEITLENSNDVIFRSGYLKPNQGIKKAELDLPLEAGTYNAVAYFCAVNFESYELLGMLEQEITLTIK